jgi:SAM-dependent methyltransferase
MGLDPVTFLRTEYVSAALFTNQIPRSADSCLQLGVYDGRAITFIPRTIRQFHTSSIEQDGVVSIGIQRALQQALKSRNILDESMQIQFYDNQRADNLTMIPDNTIDAVISMQSADKMVTNGLDWKRSIQEAIRVLKPGGRLLFVEPTDIGKDNYLDYVGTFASNTTTTDTEIDEEEERFPMLDCVGWDSVDFVVTPHVAGVFTKRMDAGMTKQERLAAEKLKEQEILAERSLSVFEGRRKKKVKKDENTKGNPTVVKK